MSSLSHVARETVGQAGRHRSRYPECMADLVLLRHGQSEWNARNLFTGWTDVGLSETGEEEARRAGALLAGAADLDLRVVHTSLLRRAIRTADLALAAAGRSWVPVRRHWRLNERHYGALQGLDKVETATRHGADQVKAWRRSYATPPPPLPMEAHLEEAADPRYRDLSPGTVPAAECLADVVRRTIPYFQDAIVPDLLAEGARGGAVLVVAHGNSLRALRKYLDQISDQDIVDLEIPTGFPYRYRLDARMGITHAGFLGDPEQARQAAAQVARQAG